MSVGRWLREAKGFAKRMANPIPEVEKRLFDFSLSGDLALWRPFSDGEVGGRSSAELVASPDVEATSGSGTATAVLRGMFDPSIDEVAAPRLKRSGYAGISSAGSHDLLDLDDFDSLVFRVKGDGNTYLASLRTENWIVGDHASDDVWQAFLFARKGEWSEVSIPLDRFALTHKGRLVEREVEMSKQRVRSIAIVLADAQDRTARPFSLGLDWIEARNTTRLDSPW